MHLSLFKVLSCRDLSLVRAAMSMPADAFPGVRIFTALASAPQGLAKQLKDQVFVILT